MLQLLRNALRFKPRQHDVIPHGVPSADSAVEPVSLLSAESATARLNALAPIKGTVASPAATQSISSLTFINREAVLNRQERIAAYEFSLNKHLQSRFSAERAAVRRVYDDLLFRSLALLGVERVLGHRLAILDVAAAQVNAGKFHHMPTQNTVLMLDPTSAERAHPSEVASALSKGREQGYRVGLRLHASAGMPACIELCDWVQIETPDFDGIELSRLVGQLRALPRGDARPLSIVAANLVTSDDFRHCYRLAIDYFQGPFVTSRERWEAPKSDVDRARVILILNKLRSGGESVELASLMQEDPVITYKFLRFINSAGMGLQTTIESVGHGLTLLGSNKFYRWLSLLLFDVKHPTYVERSLTEQALVRARFMELLARDALAPETLFLCGLFSLLDQIMGQPIEVILSKFTLAPTVSAALLHHQGEIAPLLLLAETIEGGVNDEIALHAAKCGVTVDFVNEAQLDALAFASQIATSME